MTEDRFKRSTIITLAKRAANLCSNPDCGAITSGPTEEPTGSTNVGEAAHIYGASAGAARYDPKMASADRGDITNAIWLCATCHKLIDDDQVKYPPGLLFEWQKAHERYVAERVGKAGAETRRRYEARHLEELGRLSYLAERVVLEKSKFWEFRLTVEVLRFETADTMRRWGALKRGMYMCPVERVSMEDGVPWMLDRLHEISLISEAFSQAINSEFNTSTSKMWGAPGTPGSDVDIISVCRLFADTCKQALEWEERVKFSKVHSLFEETRDLLVGVAGRILEEAMRMPAFLSTVFDAESPSGQHDLNLTFSLPDGWVEAVVAATNRAGNSL